MFARLNVKFSFDNFSTEEAKLFKDDKMYSQLKI